MQLFHCCVLSTTTSSDWLLCLIAWVVELRNKLKQEKYSMQPTCTFYDCGSKQVLFKGGVCGRQRPGLSVSGLPRSLWTGTLHQVASHEKPTGTETPAAVHIRNSLRSPDSQADRLQWSWNQCKLDAVPVSRWDGIVWMLGSASSLAQQIFFTENVAAELKTRWTFSNNLKWPSQQNAVDTAMKWNSTSLLVFFLR